MKILIIDDLPDSIKGICYFCKEKGWETAVIGFENVYQKIAEFNPDIIILDWRKDAEESDIGDPILSQIWANAFRPVVIFSANAAIIDISDKLQKSNILKVIPKGDETPVEDYLCSMEPLIYALSSYRTEMSNATIEALNASSAVLQQGVCPDNSVVKYILSKRTAFYFDLQFTGKLPPWSQYIFPPISRNLYVCDIIRALSPDNDLSKEGIPEEYKIILTPSCDMDSMHPKVTHVLCVGCYEKNEFYTHNLDAKNENDQIKKITSALNKGYNESWVPLPALTGVSPHMTVNLKKVELIEIGKIAPNISERTSEHLFVRVSSIDSPFREQIVWAHMQNSCRPGVPDRDTETWAKDLKTR